MIIKNISNHDRVFDLKSLQIKLCRKLFIVPDYNKEVMSINFFKVANSFLYILAITTWNQVASTHYTKHLY